MTTRTRHNATVFQNAFMLEGVGRLLPAGTYDVVTDEELIEGLSFPAYRRVATMIEVPTYSLRSTSSEMLTINPEQLARAQERDALMTLVNMPDPPEKKP